VGHADDYSHAVDNQTADVKFTMKKMENASDRKDGQQQVAANRTCRRHEKKKHRNDFGSAERWTDPLRETDLGEMVHRGTGKYKLQ
jgi:hypothetical protein